MSSNDLSKSFDTVPKLTGKENYLVWHQRLTVVLFMTQTRSFVLSTTIAPTATTTTSSTGSSLLLEAWNKRDGQVAAAILHSTSEDILSAHLHLLSPLDPPLTNQPVSTTIFPAYRAQTIYDSLKKTYGTNGVQYSFALAKKFVDNRCSEDEDVEEWVNKVLAQYRDLKVLSYDLNQLCGNVLLNGLPDRFSSFIDGIWKEDDTPSVENIKIKILRVSAGQRNQTNNKALAAQVSSLSMKQTSAAHLSEDSLMVFYAGLKKAGKGPSKDHPCARCGSVDW
ncbi:hypothetical protein M231_08121 [Tremella mesenterica]|uniref:Retrotransposon Copia-like N-terminal domain-containing protein n=1 Tax=Tremella mesenterica TaxID=5217 RepID=A0A4Q1BFE8_TREME|nr:hypothetical protein M231_08121 [Tremella mesenterica]